MDKAYDLRPIWNAGIELYKLIEGICKKHNLRLYVGFGTALGAIRHKGFIPWDDDIDILMPRPDYEKFWEIARVELPQYLRVYEYHVNHEYVKRFGKIFETRKDVLDNLRRASSLPLPDGVCIDIFPMDGCPKSSFDNFYWRLRMAILKSVQWAFNPPPDKTVPFKQRIKYWFGRCIKCFFARKYTHYTMFCRIEKIAEENHFDESSYAGVIGCIYGEKAWRIPSSVYGKGVEVPFEDTTVIVPDDCDLYLKHVYGDYMKLPPVEKQVPHHFL